MMGNLNKWATVTGHKCISVLTSYDTFTIFQFFHHLVEIGLYKESKIIYATQVIYRYSS